MKCAFVGATPLYATNGVATYLRRINSCSDYFKMHDWLLIGVFGGDGTAAPATTSYTGSGDVHSEHYISFRSILSRRHKDQIKSLLSGTSAGSKVSLYYSHIKYAKRAVDTLLKHAIQPDVIVFNDPFTLTEYLNRSPDSKCKICIVTHDNGEFGKMLKESYPKLPSAYIDPLLSNCLNYADCIIEVGKKSYKRFCEHYPNFAYKTVQINTGIPSVDISIHEKKDEVITLVNVGTLCSRKNQANLIEAIANPVNRRRFRLILVGGGPDFDQCKDLVCRYGLSKCVTMTGPSNEVSRFLCQSDAYISVSLDEGLPIAMIEAMSCGLPLITSQAGSCPDLVEENGYVFNGFDTASISSALDWLYSNRSDLGSMGKNSRAMYESRYTLSCMCDSYIELFNKMVA